MADRDTTVWWVLTALGIVLVMASLVTLGAGAYIARRRHGQAFVLAPTILFAFGLMLTSVGWLISPDVPRGASEAIRSGALASAAVLALYALWLNDQRRRTEQHRLETERERGQIEQNRLSKELDQLGLERRRIVDERFTKAIELLGNASDRTRIGALILLDSLTRTRPDLIPDVLDQICGYLRGPVGTNAEDVLAEEQDRRVRRHAQRVLCTVLKRATTDAVTVAELDLSGAVLDEFHLDGGTVGILRLDKARLTGRTTLCGVVAAVLSMVNCTADDDVVLDTVVENGRATGRIGRLVVTGAQARFDGRFVCRCDLGSVEIESAEFMDTFELNNLMVTDRFAAHAKFHRRMTVTHVVFAEPLSIDSKSIDLFRCEFGDLVLIDDTDVHGATRLAGVNFDGGLRLNARFHGGRVSAEEAFVAGHAEAVLPTGWRLDPHSATHRRLVAPRR